MSDLNIEPLIGVAIERTKELCQHKHYDLATEFCETMIELDAENPDVWFLYGVTQVGMNKPMQAIVSFDNAAKFSIVQTNKDYVIKCRDQIRTDLAGLH